MTKKADTSSEPDVGAPLIGALLRVPWESVRARMLSGLHDRGFADLNAAHLNVLQYPGPHGLRPSELADRTRMSKQALNYLLGQMEQAGYLARGADPDDQRSKRITLTARGQKALRAIREIVGELEREWEREIGAARFAALRELLVELNGHVGEPGRERAATATSEPRAGTARGRPSRRS